MSPSTIPTAPTITPNPTNPTTKCPIVLNLFVSNVLDDKDYP